MLESDFKQHVKDLIMRTFPNYDIEFIEVKHHRRSFPDTLCLVDGKWFVLEFKGEFDSDKRANQEYHINRLNNKGGFASFCFPENLEDVLYKLDMFLNPWKQNYGSRRF